MGTDIHMVIESQRHVWQFEPDAPIYDNRNYDVFAMIADVRNGSGFAGVDTGDGFVPLAPRRGLPANASKETYRALADGDVPRKGHPWRNTFGLGDHSLTHCTLAELNAYDLDRTTKQRGIIGPEQYREYAKNGRPSEWCGGVWGSGVVVVEEAEMIRMLAKNMFEPTGDEHRPLRGKDGKSYYTQISWTITYRDAGRDFFVDYLTMLRSWASDQRLAAGQVRLIVGFDS